jgi:hypothetical protein
LVFGLFAVASYFDIHSWPLSAFIGASGIGFVLGGIGYYRVAKRNTERGAA